MGVDEQHPWSTIGMVEKNSGPGLFYIPSVGLLASKKLNRFTKINKISFVKKCHNSIALQFFDDFMILLCFSPKSPSQMTLLFAPKNNRGPVGGLSPGADEERTTPSWQGAAGPRSKSGRVIGS